MDENKWVSLGLFHPYLAHLVGGSSPTGSMRMVYLYLLVLHQWLIFMGFHVNKKSYGSSGSIWYPPIGAKVVALSSGIVL